MKLVICEKPSVGAAVAAALGVTGKKTDISRETATSFLLVYRAFGTAFGSCRLWGTVQKMEL